MVPKLEVLATRTLSNLLASGREDVLRDISSVPLSLVLPCLEGVRDPLYLAAVEDAFGEEAKAMLDRNWRLLFERRRFVCVDTDNNKNDAADNKSNEGKAETEPFGDWRKRYEQAVAAEEAKLASLGAKLRDRWREEERLKASKKIAVLEAPPRPPPPPLARGAPSSSSSSSSVKSPGTNHQKQQQGRSTTGVRDRLIKKLSSSSSAAAAKRAVAAKTATRAAATTTTTTTTSIPPYRLARPLVVPGNEPQRRKVIGGGSSSTSGAVARHQRQLLELEEAPLFDDDE